MYRINEIDKNMLIYSSLDRVTSEEIPYIRELFFQRGAKNINLLPSVGKKGRPNFIIFIDFPKDKYQQIIDTLVIHAKSTGWYIISDEHRYLKLEESVYSLKIVNNNIEAQFAIRYKFLCNKRYNQVFLEHDDCYDLFIKYPDHFVTIENLKKQVLNNILLEI